MERRLANNNVSWAATTVYYTSVWDYCGLFIYPIFNAFLYVSVCVAQATVSDF
jgi:hypothetical protein